MITPTPYHVETSGTKHYVMDGDGNPIASVRRQEDAQFLADVATVVLHAKLWGLGPGFEAAPSIAMVWLQQGGQPVPFEGATLQEAIHKAAEHIRKGGTR